MPRNRFVVADYYVDQAVKFLKQYADFFAAALLDADFQNWCRQSRDQARDMAYIDAVMRDMLAISKMPLSEQTILSYLELSSDHMSLLDLDNLREEGYDCLIEQYCNTQESLFELFAQGLLKQFTYNGDSGVFYGKSQHMELLLCEEPVLVSRLLCLKNSPVFERVYASWIDSYEHTQFMKQFSDLTEANLGWLNYVLTSNGFRRLYLGEQEVAVNGNDTEFRADNAIDNNEIAHSSINNVCNFFNQIAKLAYPQSPKQEEEPIHQSTKGQRSATADNPQAFNTNI